MRNPPGKGAHDDYRTLRRRAPCYRRVRPRWLHRLSGPVDKESSQSARLPSGRLPIYFEWRGKAAAPFLDSEHRDRVIALAGDHDLIAQLGADSIFNQPGSCDTLSARANEEIEEAGGAVLRHELWIESGNLDDGDLLNDDMSYSIDFYASPDIQDMPWR